MDKKEIALSEYQSVRSEIRQFFQLQFTIMTIFIALLGVLFGYMYGSHTMDENTQKLLLAFIVPGFSAFFGILWLDLALRIKKCGIYCLELEKNYYPEEDKEPHGYEHYLVSLTKDKGLFRENYIYYLITCGCLFFVPYFVSIGVLSLEKLSLDFCHLTLMAFVYTIMAYFATIEIQKLLAYDPEREQVDYQPFILGIFSTIGLILMIYYKYLMQVAFSYVLGPCFVAVALVVLIVVCLEMALNKYIGYKEKSGN